MERKGNDRERWPGQGVRTSTQVFKKKEASKRTLQKERPREEAQDLDRERERERGSVYEIVRLRE